MCRFQVIPALLTALLVGAIPAHAQSERRPVIDVHLHALPANSVADEVAIPGLDRAPTDEALMVESLSALERYNVVRAVLSGPLAMVERWNTAAPDRVIAASFMGIIPAPEGGSLEWPALGDLRSAYDQGKLRVLGEIGAQYMGLTLSSPEFEPYLTLAEEFDIPVAVHTGSGPPGAPYQTDFPEFRAALGNPLLIEDALVRHPGLRLYIMHGGYPFLDETITLLTVYPQAALSDIYTTQINVYGSNVASLASYVFIPDSFRPESRAETLQLFIWGMINLEGQERFPKEVYERHLPALRERVARGH